MVKANATFVIADPDTFVYQVIQEGEEIPAWALDKVTNPGILDGYETETTTEFGTGAVAEEVVVEPTPGDDVDDGVDLPDNSWKKAEIVDFLEERGVELTGSETKDELLALTHGEDV